MTKPILISASDICQLAGIEQRRFDQRRQRQPDLLPVAPTKPGRHARFDALDAARLRSVIQLELAGMSFAAASAFIRGAGIGPAIMFPSDDDTFAAQWLGLGGVVRRVCGSRRELRRAMPECPWAAISINLSAIVQDVDKRAQSLLGLTVRGGQFSEELTP